MASIPGLSAFPNPPLLGQDQTTFNANASATLSNMQAYVDEFNTSVAAFNLYALTGGIGYSIASIDNKELNPSTQLTAVGGETSLLTGDNTAVVVYKNGVKLILTTDYTLNVDGLTINFVVALTLNDLIQVWELNKSLDSPALVNPTINGVAQSGYTGFKNLIINGGFDVWQRGSNASLVSGSETYFADRWVGASAVSTYVYDSSTYFGRGAVTINGASSTTTWIEQRVESANARKIANSSKATISIEVHSLSAFTFTQSVAYMDTKDSNSSYTEVDSQLFSHTGSGYETFSFTITPVSDMKNGFRVRFLTTDQGTIVVTILNIQLEEGSVATPFEQRPIGLELSLCQRYYEIGAIGILNTSNNYAIFQYLSEKRVSPTIDLFNGYGQTSAGITINSSSYPKQGFITYNTVLSGANFTASAEL